MAKNLAEADFSRAMPPRVPPLSPDEDALLKIMQRKRGRLYTVTEMLTVMGENIHIWDNHAACIRVLCQMVEHKRCVAGWIEESGKDGWMVPKPKGDVDGAMTR